MKNIKFTTIILLLVLIGHNAFGQKSNVFYEYKYLELTNTQGDLEVIKDNYRNAELVSDSIIINLDENYINAHFYYELANAYKLNNEYGMWAFSLLRQLILFPNDSLKRAGAESFVIACSTLKFENIDAIGIYKKSAEGINTKSFSARLELLMEQSIELWDKDVEKVLKRYVYQFEKLNTSKSIKIKQWEFLNKIDLDLNSRKEIFGNYYGSDNKDPFLNNSKLKNKVTSKINKYNKKHHTSLSLALFE